MEQFTPQQLAFLDAQRAGRLATADRLGQPHVVPVCYACACVTLYIEYQFVALELRPVTAIRPSKIVAWGTLSSRDHGNR